MFVKPKEIIEKSDTIYLVAHVNPDGDAIGSTFALCKALQKIGKKAHVIMPSYSDTFSFLPDIKEAVKMVEEDEYDLLICLDSNSKERLAISDVDFKKAKKVLMLDHHEIKTNNCNKYADVEYVDSNLPATCEIVYNLIEYLGIDIDVNIATYLYAGILTDTGSFRYSSTKPSTFLVASKLIAKGIDFTYIARKLTDEIKEAKLKLISKTIGNMEVYFNGRLRYSYVNYDTIKSLGLDDEDAEGMTNYLRMVEGTDVAIYVRGKSDGTNKVSMRSSENVDVSKIAIEFNGGGHKRASGYTMYSDYESEKELLINKIGELME